jgi:hypothetical protein
MRCCETSPLGVIRRRGGRGHKKFSYRHVVDLPVGGCEPRRKADSGQMPKDRRDVDPGLQAADL